MELASPSSRASLNTSMSGGDNGSVILMDNDGAIVSADAAIVGAGTAAPPGGGSPFSRLRHSFVSFCDHV